MKEKKIILQDSPEAASIKTVTGWVSSNGQFWGDDERMARYCGSTHRACECGELIEQRGYCEKCYNKQEAQKFAAMERKPWDGNAMLYSRTKDRYYETPDDATYDLDEGQTLESLELIICTPNYATISEEDFEDDLPSEDYGDSTPPQCLLDAIAAFNESMQGVALSFEPGKYALDCSTDNKGAEA